MVRMLRFAPSERIRITHYPNPFDAFRTRLAKPSTHPPLTMPYASRSASATLAAALLLLLVTPAFAQTARIQAIHNSPYAEAAAVDVYFNGELQLDDFAFRSATPFIDVPADSAIVLDITTADAPDNSAPVFTLDLAVCPGQGSRGQPPTDPRLR